jgi:glycosyltransferase involved in cell wall biosynthesis
MPEVSSLRDYHKNDIDLFTLYNRIDYILDHRKRFDNYIRYTSRSTKQYYEPHHRNNLKDLAEVLIKNRSNIKFVIVGSWAYIYSNDLKFLEMVSKLEYVSSCSFTEIKINRPRDTVKLRKSKHKFRIYFPDMWITAEQKASIVAFLTSQEDIRLSPGLKTWCHSLFYWTQRSHFIDCNTASMGLALQLIHPRLVRKTLQIVEVNS